MPTYEYECKSCRHRFEVFQSMKDEPLKVCPKCNKELRRLINGGTGIIFRGNGFYVTDKSGKDPKTIKNNSDEKTGEGSHKDQSKTAAACQGCSKAETCPKAANS